MKQLNANQKIAVLLNDVPLRIIAGAGTGKTTVVCEKIKYLINNVALKPYRILAITFTNKAASEMRDRVLSDINSRFGVPVIKTYHSFCAKFLRSEITALGFGTDFIILDADDQKALVSNVVTARGFKKSDFKPKQLLNIFSKWAKEKYTINDLKKASDEEDADQVLLYEDYLNMKLQHNVLDFDDLILKTELILAKFPEIAEKWSNFYDYVLVDEFQDTSFFQYNIVKSLTIKKQNLCVVGDPDQTIYSWRGANVDIIINLKNDYPKLETIALTKNYRSPQKILNLANDLIINNQNRIAKELHSDDQEQLPILYYDAPSTTGEAHWVCEQIKELQSKEKVALNEIAVLYRLNRISLYLEQALINEGLPYKIIGNINFFSRKEIKDLLSYLWVVIHNNNFYLERIINVPTRAIGKKTWNKIRDYANDNKLHYYDALRDDLSKIGLTNKVSQKLEAFIAVIENARAKLNVVEPNQILTILNELLINSGYKQYLLDLSITEKKFLGSRIDNVIELFKFIDIRIKNNPNKSQNNFEILADILADLNLLSNHNNDESQQAKPRPKIQLMTVHHAKGLEFPYVFIVGLNEEIAPFSRSLLNIEEERRIIYVAVTRAQKRLFITSATRFSFDKIDTPLPVSRFINEIRGHLTVATPIPRTKLRFESFEEPKLKREQNYSNEETHFIIGDVIEHKIFGLGTVVNIENDIISVAFKFNTGVKKFFKNHKSITKH